MLIAAVTIKQHWIEIEDAAPLTSMMVQMWVQIDDGDFDVPIAAATTSAPEISDSYQGWVAHFAPNIQPADHLITETPMIPPLEYATIKRCCSNPTDVTFEREDKASSKVGL